MTPVLVDEAQRLRAERENHLEFPLSIFVGKILGRAPFIVRARKTPEIQEIGVQLKRCSRLRSHPLSGGLPGDDADRVKVVVGIEYEDATRRDLIRRPA